MATCLTLKLRSAGDTDDQMTVDPTAKSGANVIPRSTGIIGPRTFDAKWINTAALLVIYHGAVLNPRSMSI